MAKMKFVENAPLKKDDNVICMSMVDDFSPVPGGTPGTVSKISELPYRDEDGVTHMVKHYYVKWKSGSNLALIEGYWVDATEEECKEQKAKYKRLIRVNDGSENPKKKGVWQYKNGDTWIKLENEEPMNESIVFFTTKGKLINEIKK